MATENITLPDAMDAHSSLTAKLAQLQALLMMTYGEARESIDNMNETLRDNYFWACSDMANDCLKLANDLEPILFKWTPITNATEITEI